MGVLDHPLHLSKLPSQSVDVLALWSTCLGADTAFFHAKGERLYLFFNFKKSNYTFGASRSPPPQLTARNNLWKEILYIVVVRLTVTLLDISVSHFDGISVLLT